MTHLEGSLRNMTIHTLPLPTPPVVPRSPRVKPLQAVGLRRNDENDDIRFDSYCDRVMTREGNMCNSKE